MAFGIAAATALLLAPTSGAASTSSTLRMAPRAEPTAGVSSNWAGYVVTAPQTTTPAAGATFTDVTGGWVQSKATCDTGEATASAFWVGLGGVDESTQGLEQLGTEADCSANGRTTYSAWYELLPAGPVELKMRIRPRDKITAAVLSDGQGVVVSLKDTTAHTRFSKRIPVVDPLDLGSAEWIAEAPSACDAGGQRCRAVPLTNFGTVRFTGAATVGGSHPGTISDPAWATEQVSLVPDPNAPGFGGATNTHGAAANALSPDGRSFSVAWQRTPATSSP